MKKIPTWAIEPPNKQDAPDGFDSSYILNPVTNHDRLHNNRVRRGLKEFSVWQPLNPITPPTTDPEPPTPAGSFSTDSWELIASRAEAGTASTFYSVGDTRTIEMPSLDETITVAIFGFNHDNKLSGGKAGITIGMTGVIGYGYTPQDAHDLLQSEARAALPAELQAVIKEVHKINGAGSIWPSANKLFLFSVKEIENTTDPNYSGQGEQYEYWRTVKDGTNPEDRAKDGWWYTRTPWAENPDAYCTYTSDGMLEAEAENARICFGFCI